MHHIDARRFRKGDALPSSLARQSGRLGSEDARPPTSQTTAGRRPTHPWLALTALGFGIFMALLDTSIVNVALPTLQTQLQADLPSVSWILHLYNLFFAVCLVTSGRLADLFGRKRCVLLGLVLFTSGSVLCGAAPSLFWLCGARVLQAIGAALLSAASMALVHALFPTKQRALAMSVFGSLNALGAALGPVLGGLLLPQFGWRSIFLVNVPFCLIGLLLVSLFVPEMRVGSGEKRLDGVGLITISLALLSLVLAVIKGSDWGWSSPQILSLFGWAVMGLLLFVLVERRHPSPLLDLTLFRAPGFSLANLVTFLYSVALQGGTLFLTLYFVSARGEPTLSAAVAFLPVPLAACVCSNGVSVLARGLPAWVKGLLGLCLMVVGLLLFCSLTMQSPSLDVLWRESLFGAGIGLCVGSFPTVALAEVPSAQLGAASGAVNTCRQVGFVFGVALFIGLFSGHLSGNLHVARSDSMILVRTDHRLPSDLRDTLVAHFFSTGMQTPPPQKDLMELSNEHPSWQAARGELRLLGDTMGQLFDTQTLHAYSLVWVLAAAFPMAGIGLVVALLLVRRSLPQRQTAAWRQWYFFSFSGGVTVQTVHGYLARRPPAATRSSADPPRPGHLSVSQPHERVFPVMSVQRKGARP